MKHSEHFKKIILTAKQIAKNNLIETETLLNSIVLCTDTYAYKLILKLEVNVLNISILQKEYEKHINKEDDTTSSKVKISSKAEAIIQQAQLEAKKFKSDTIHSEHLLLALARSGEYPILIYTNIEKLINNNMNEIEDEPQNRQESKSNEGPTPMLDQFSTDLTKLAYEGKLDPVVGREVELKRISQILSRRRKNNPIIIGDSGTGKSSLVELLAQRIVSKNVPDSLLDKKILTIELGSIVAGTKYRGEFEERMKKIVDELKNHQNIIIFIDEIHTMVGAGGSSGALDAANILKPALSRGEISCIGATTNEEFKTIEKDKALSRRFQKVKIDEPTIDETLIILNNVKKKYEDFHIVKYSNEAIKACVKLSEKYLSDRAFPDKAIDLLDEAGAYARLSYETPTDLISKDEELSKVIELKMIAVKEQLYEKAAEYKVKQSEIENDIRLYKLGIKENRLNNRKVVTVDDVSTVVSIMTGIPSKNISETDTEKLLSLGKTLKSVIIGQDEAIDSIAKAILRTRAGLNDGLRPSSFLCIGSSGVGKTLIAKKLAENLFTSDKDMIRIDMSEYMEKHSVAKLIGAPPGYVGHEDGGQLTDAVRKKPYSVILLDEIEKAHPDVANILLQVFDDGRLTDSQGRVVDFRNTIIIMTSNIGTKEAKQRGPGIGFTSSEKDMTKSIIDKELGKKFPPEFINRIDDVIYFNSLNKENIKKIIDIEVGLFSKRLNDNGIELSMSDSAKDFLFEKGYSDTFGARQLRRTLQKFIQDEISIKIITKEIKSGDVVVVSKSETEDKLEFVVEISEKVIDELEVVQSDVLQLETEITTSNDDVVSDEKPKRKYKKKDTEN